jgi:hypothetical protein
MVARGGCPLWSGAYRREEATAEGFKDRDVHSEERKEAIDISRIS